MSTQAIFCSLQPSVFSRDNHLFSSAEKEEQIVALSTIFKYFIVRSMFKSHEKVAAI